MFIRQETAADHEAVYEVVKTAFATAEHSDGNEQDLVNALRNSTAFLPELSLVAMVGSKIVGHILYTKVDIGGTTALALAPLSVLPQFQQQGIGKALMLAGHDIARALGFGYSVVLGSPDYYPKAGYAPADNFGIVPPFDVPEGHYMVLKLDPHAPPCHGTVKYDPAFD